MSEYNDLFDELIGDESDTESSTYFTGDEDEENKASTARTAILAKGDMLASITLKTTGSDGQIIRLDPRDPLPTARRYDDCEQAIRWFRRSLSPSAKNGWRIIYDGQPLFG